MNTDIATIKSLLSHVSSIAKKYDEIAALTGENFNIFSVMKLESDEVRLHSRLLGELLNPYGKHGMNEVFLKLFIKSIGLEDEYTHETYEKVEIIVEENIGNISDDYEKGGRIDIVVKFKSGKENIKDIVIENKIYAEDQNKQLARYYNHYPNSNLVYLTLYGRNPGEKSVGENLDILNSIKNISYQKHILKWLEQCHEKTTNYPLLRETIKQYIYLIKKLTNQTMSENMKKELAELISRNPEYIDSAQKITEVWEECKFKIVENLKPKIEEIAKGLGLNYEISEDVRFGDFESRFWFYKDNWDFCILFFFITKLENIIVGIDDLENKTKCSEQNKHNIIKALENFDLIRLTGYENWIWVSNFSEWEKTKWNEIEHKMPKQIELILEKLIVKLMKINN
jgi:hypothetical protein